MYRFSQFLSAPSSQNLHCQPFNQVTFLAVAKHTCEKKKTGKTEVRHTPSGQNL